jgi:hypothetical protein
MFPKVGKPKEMAKLGDDVAGELRDACGDVEERRFSAA